MKFIFVALLVYFAVSIQTDGVISDGEWSGAEQFDLGNENKVLLKHDNDVLYVALNGPRSFWAHFYLSDGKKVKVMHASAALGAIEYKQEKALWRTSDKAFVYELRDREYNAAKMEEYYVKHGFSGNNNNVGDKKTVELKINLEGFKPMYFACVMATQEKYYSYPLDLKDNTVLTRLVQGYVVDSLKFEPKTWRKL